jgi:hypothetical protein
MNHLLATTYNPEEATIKDFNDMEADLSHDLHRANILIERLNDETDLWCKGFRGSIDDLKDHLTLLQSKSERLEDIRGGLMRQMGEIPCFECEGKGMAKYPYPSRLDPECEAEWDTCHSCRGRKVVKESVRVREGEPNG